LADKGGRSVSESHKLFKLTLIFMTYVTFFEFGIGALLLELPHIWADKSDYIERNLDLKIRQEMYDPYVVSFEFWLIARVFVIAFALFAVVDQSHAAICGFQAAVFLWDHVSFTAKILAIFIPCILTYVNVWIIFMYFTLIQTSESFLDIFLNYAAFQVFIEADDLLWKVAIGDKTPAQVYPSLRDMLVTSCSEFSGRIHSTLQVCFIMRVIFKCAKLQLILFISWFLVKGYYDIIDQPQKSDVWLHGLFGVGFVLVLYCFFMICRRCLHDADVRYHLEIEEGKVWVRPHYDDDDFYDKGMELASPEVLDVTSVSIAEDKRIGGEVQTQSDATRAGSTVGGTRVDSGSIYDGIPIHGGLTGEIDDYEMGVE